MASPLWKVAVCSVLAGLVLSHGVQARLRRDACVTGTCAAAWCVRNAADWTLALGICKDIMQALVVPSGCFVLAATVLLVLLCFTGSDCVLHQLPRVLGQPRQIRTRANPSCAPIPRVLGSPASSMSASRVAWFQLGLPCE